MRLFFAIWPPPAAAAALETWARALQGRATPADKIHLTLAFLGEADAARAGRAARRVRGSAHRLPIERARYWQHNEIVWVGPAQTPPQLEELARALQLELYREEFILERRPFAAHVTLLRKAPRPETLPELPSLDWPVEEFTLVRSQVSSRGSSYEIVECFRLA